MCGGCSILQHPDPTTSFLSGWDTSGPRNTTLFRHGMRESEWSLSCVVYEAGRRFCFSIIFFLKLIAPMLLLKRIPSSRQSMNDAKIQSKHA